MSHFDACVVGSITTTSTSTTTTSTTTIGIPSEMCDDYCESIGYSWGRCISNSPTCRRWGGTMESGTSLK
jgi:hypothetical protein